MQTWRLTERETRLPVDRTRTRLNAKNTLVQDSAQKDSPTARLTNRETGKQAVAIQSRCFRTVDSCPADSLSSAPWSEKPQSILIKLSFHLPSTGVSRIWQRLPKVCLPLSLTLIIHYLSLPLMLVISKKVICRTVYKGIGGVWADFAS